MKVSELIGEKLDYWVARANGWTFGPPHKIHEWDVWRDSNGEITGIIPAQSFQPSANWAHGGPIIDREKISLTAWQIGDWTAEKGMIHNGGKTALVAAMRAYVTSKFGGEVPE